VFSISSAPIESIPRSTAESAVGATVVFEGIVRNTNEGHAVESLEYEAMESLACKEGARILDEAKAKFSVLSIECVHRVGHLKIGEIAIRVVVTSGHRREAFEACQLVVDEIKTRVPIWKKEHYVSGASEWINALK
jgi:molybdopterin synthase catalytic subunit